MTKDDFGGRIARIPQICPKCGKPGSYQPKSVKGHTYWYFQHGDQKPPKWHYVGKARPKGDSPEVKEA